MRWHPPDVPFSPFGRIRTSHSRPRLLNAARKTDHSSAKSGTPSRATKRPLSSTAQLPEREMASAAAAGSSAVLRAAAEALACSRRKLAARAPKALGDLRRAAVDQVARERGGLGIGERELRRGTKRRLQRVDERRANFGADDVSAAQRGELGRPR